MTRTLHTFHGGLHLPEHKAESTGRSLAVAPVPRVLVIPVQQHIGQPAKPVVQVGERVLKGQMIAQAEGYVSVPAHASSSGVVIAIEERAVPHPSGLNALCVVIETDGRDEALDFVPMPEWAREDPSHLRNRVRDAGIVGLGGAGFPSYVKLNPGPRTVVDTLIINGAECEPYITADDMLMRERADEVIGGVRIMIHALQARSCVIAVEDNKPEAFAALGEALQRSGRSDIELVQVPTRYPTGGEKQLIKVVTGKEVPSTSLPIAIGVVVQNVATAAAVYRAIEKGEPLISRIVTVTGGAVATPHNIEVRIGTSVADLIAFAGGLKAEPERLVLGGPMMGITLQSRDVPITKTAGCVLAPVAGELGERGPTRACIRCGACAEVCPMSLLPQQLYWHARAKDFDKAQDHKLFDCIECGCCSYVCPSNLPLVQFIRFAKTAVWAQEREKKKADRARERHEFRQARIEAEKAEREARLKKKAADAEGAASPDDAKKAAIQAALERTKAKKAAAAAAGDSEQ
jgi:electron transport complex protein RnfC